jgi:hypothetical protein
MTFTNIVSLKSHENSHNKEDIKVLSIISLPINQPVLPMGVLMLFSLLYVTERFLTGSSWSIINQCMLMMTQTTSLRVKRALAVTYARLRDVASTV